MTSHFPQYASPARLQAFTGHFTSSGDRWRPATLVASPARLSCRGPAPTTAEAPEAHTAAPNTAGDATGVARDICAPEHERGAAAACEACLAVARELVHLSIAARSR